MRAPTPSGAAELAVPDKTAVLSKLDGLESRIRSLLINALGIRKRHFETLAGSYVFSAPMRMFENKYITLDKLSEKLDGSLKLSLERKKSDFGAAISKLEALSPLSVLSRGYAAVYSDQKNVVSSIGQLERGQSFNLEMSDGCVMATVNEITERKMKSGKGQKDKL